MEYYGTLGPACGNMETLKKMLETGMTGVRLNLSHGGLEENGTWIRMVREAGEELGVRADILIDLEGPEVRLGRLKEERKAEEGQTLILGEGGIPAPEEAVRAMAPGDRLLIDDGKLELEVREIWKEPASPPQPGMAAGKNSREAGGVPAESDAAIRGPVRPGERSCICAVARVVRGGLIKSGKSLAIEGKSVPMPTLTENDRKNIRLAARYGVTGVMLPFVRKKEDLLTLREALHGAGADHIRIFAKIENLQGVESVHELLPYCDQVVIARGDLGNAIPLWKLPGLQKRLARECRKEKKPFMVVTQMLDSMHERAVPTRAEVLDIYNAVLDGAASLMLTGETAAGRYPAEAIRYLVNTGEEALRDRKDSGRRDVL